MTRRMEIVAIIAAGLAALATAHLIQQAAIDTGDVLSCGDTCAKRGKLVASVPPYSDDCECITRAEWLAERED